MPNSNHRTITSRDENSQVVGADIMAPTLFKAFTMDNSSSKGVNTKGKPSEAIHITDSHISHNNSTGDYQGPKRPVWKMCPTTGELVIPDLMYCRTYESPHVCLTRSSLIEDEGSREFIESMLQNEKKKRYDVGYTPPKLMYCARGAHWLPLHVFALTGNLSIVKFLLKKFLSINAKMKYRI